MGDDPDVVVVRLSELDGKMLESILGVFKGAHFGGALFFAMPDFPLVDAGGREVKVTQPATDTKAEFFTRARGLNIDVSLARVQVKNVSFSSGGTKLRLKKGYTAFPRPLSFSILPRTERMGPTRRSERGQQSNAACRLIRMRG